MEHAAFHNMKFRVENEEHSRQIQEALFKLGHHWGESRYVVNDTDMPYLYTTDGQIQYGSDEFFYQDDPNKDCTLEDLHNILVQKGIMQPVERPPLGLRPKHVVTSLRIKEILEACSRYAEAGKEIPGEWLEELGELNGGVA